MGLPVGETSITLPGARRGRRATLDELRAIADQIDELYDSPEARKNASEDFWGARGRVEHLFGDGKGEHDDGGIGVFVGAGE